MVKIKGLYLSLTLVAMIIIASVDILFMKGTAGYNLLILYAIILSLFAYAGQDLKTDRKSFTLLLFTFLGVLAVCMGQYVFSFHSVLLIWLGAVFMGLGFIFILISGSFAPEEKKSVKTQSFRREPYIFILIIIFAFVVRIYNLEKIPPGIWFDEAQNGNEAIHIMAGRPLEIFIPRFTMMPAMFFYIASFFMKVFGVTISALRFVSVLAGVLSVAAFYFLCRQIFKKEWLALLGAFLLASSRWHITFSRVAFLGMLTLLLVIICFYFYLRAIEKGTKVDAVLAGLAMGLSLYTFSGADFIPIIVLLYSGLSLIRFKEAKFRKIAAAGAITILTAVILGAPLVNYAVKNPDIFSKRFKDLSIANDIEKTGNIKPILSSIGTHALMFNYEGDYNGRHNLFKKPMLDNFTGVLFAVGIFIAVSSSGNGLYLLWFLIMLSAGVLTISVEAPQAYRIIGIVPVVYIFVIMALNRIYNSLLAFGRSAGRFMILALILVLSIAGINIYNYFVLYPASDAAYLSFSPEANGIAGFIRANSGEYGIYATTSGNMYGFYPWEQLFISEFVNYGGPAYWYLKDDNKVDESVLAGRKGIIVLLRPNDYSQIRDITQLYPKTIKKEFTNRVTDEVMFICYYIEMRDLKSKPVKEKTMLLYK